MSLINVCMIPKVIHYCWFGRGPMTKLAMNCIQSWKKYCPDYQLKLWNEDNFDLDLYPYVREAYEKKKFAFVSDVVRLYALYTEGGIYMDTDVEVIKNLDPFLKHVAFSGFESKQFVPTGIMASERGGQWVKDNLDYYIGKHFVNNDGSMNLEANVTFMTQMLIKKGLRLDDTFQDFPGYLTIYPKEYFCPLTQPILINENTATIHHFSGSWLPKKKRVENHIMMIIGKSKSIYKIIHKIHYFFKKN